MDIIKNNVVVKPIPPSATYPLRHSVLWPHIALETDCTIDIDQREDAVHLGAFLGKKLVSICSLFEMKSEKLEHQKQYRLRAMATHPDFRNQDVGRKLVEFAIDLLREKHYDILWCDAREVALGFYSKIGFRIQGDWYEVPHVGKHKTMYFDLMGDA